MANGFGERKPAGASTRKFAGVILGTALRHAVRIKLIAHNPAAHIAKARPPECEMKFMTGPQVKRFLTAARGQPLHALFITAVGTGARQGELLGLQWADIDFEKGTMDVRRSLAWVKKEPILKEPKSKAGKRTIALPPFVLTALRDHRAEALKAGLIAAPVFCTRTKRHLDKKNVLRSFKNVVAKVNAVETEEAAKLSAEPDLIPASIRFHDIRHSHATALIASGQSIKAVSRRLGHGTIEITLRVYAHLMPSDDEKLATGVEALYG
jgi:integrase